VTILPARRWPLLMPAFVGAAHRRARAVL